MSLLILLIKQMTVPALAFCDLTISVKIHPSPFYPKEVKTIGDHIRKVRLDRMLLQKDLAKLFKVHLTTIVGWEKNQAIPHSKYAPLITQFLGYDAFPKQTIDIGEQIKAYRLKRGLSREWFAKLAGVSWTSVGIWERKLTVPKPGLIQRLEKVLGLI